MTRAAQTEKRLREAILELLAYHALFSVTLSDSEILEYLPVRASIVGVRAHLGRLVSRGKIIKNSSGRYQLKHHKYSTKRRFRVSKETKKICKYLRKLPFVKAIAVNTDDVLSSNNSNKDYQSLVIVTLPNRIYLTKKILAFLYARVYKTKKSSHNIDVLACKDILYTSKGLRFEQLMGRSELSRAMWFAHLHVLYNETLLTRLMRENVFLENNLPNYPWVYDDGRIFTNTNKSFDTIDNTLYREALAQMARVDTLQRKDSLLRVRPDVYIAQVDYLAHTQTMQEKFEKIKKVA